MEEGKMAFLFWNGDSVIDHMEFYLDIALDYAIINWGLTLCGGKR